MKLTYNSEDRNEKKNEKTATNHNNQPEISEKKLHKSIAIVNRKKNLYK